MAAYLPVPITAVHTTSVDYCAGDGMISRFVIDSTEGVPTKTVNTHGTLGRYIRLRGYVAEIDIPAGVTGINLGAFLWEPGSPGVQPYNVLEFLNGSAVVVLRLEKQNNGTLILKRGSTTLATATSLLNADPKFFEVIAEFHDSTGVFQLRANVGSLEINFSGDTLDAAGPVTAVRIKSRPRANEFTDLGIAGGYARERDGSTFWGRGTYRYLPYGDDISGQVDFLGNSSGSNADHINETNPDGDAMKVSSSTDGAADNYQAPDGSPVTGAVKCLWNYQGCKQDGSALLHSTITPDGGSLTVDPDGRLVPFAAYGGVATAYETIPGTATPWSGTSISAIDSIGFELEVP